MKRPKLNQRGFTIAELMIATLVFSVVLLLVTTGIIQIGRTYYKGINEANTQDTARTIMETVGQAVQFSGGTVGQTDPTEQAGVLKAFCVGNTQFSYRLGTQLVTASPGTGQSTSVLRENTVNNCNAASPPMSTGQELLSPKMRLSELVVMPAPGGVAFTIRVKVVYGDSDLLNNPTTSAAACKGSNGSQFCSDADISTTVYKRVN